MRLSSGAVARSSLLPALRGAAVLGALLFASESHAYCRTTTCDAKVSCKVDPEECCAADRHGCETNGTPVAWPNSCVSFSVQEDGSPLRGVSAAELNDVIETALSQWLSSACNGEGVSLTTEGRGTVICDQVDFAPGPGDRNANIWMFRDEVTTELMESDVLLDGSTLAVTTVTFQPSTAYIVDADVELLSAVVPFTTGDSDVQIDLASVVTHEAGHFLGLDHTRVPGATMLEGQPPGTTTGRNLHADDRAGICATYPLDREITGRSCEPVGKYHEKCEGDGCDCRFAPGRGAINSASTWGALALSLGALLGRRAARKDGDWS